jgi:hypothetical protein
MGRRLLIIATLGVAAGIGHGDELKLTDGGRLTGTVVSMKADGSLTIEADVALDAIEVRPGRIRRVDFSNEAPAPLDHDARVQLINGDMVPCDLLSIGDKEIAVRTAFAGDLSIARDVIDRMQLGIRPHRVILSGLGDEAGWLTPSDQWSIQDDQLVSSGTGFVGRAFDELPPAFSLSFDLKWEQRPAFKVFFCSHPGKGSGGELDRYYLQFNTAGFELKRQSTGKTSYHPLGVVNRGPEDFREREVSIELRVDRPARMLYLYLDGELEGRFPDQLDEMPEASGIVFESGTKGERAHVVSNLELRQWNASGDRHKGEDRGDEKADAVIDHDGQRFGGKLLETAVRDGQPVVLFQSPHLADALEIPVNRISTIFLAGNKAESKGSPLFFGLAAGGRLSAASGRFDDRTLFLEHELLGPLEIQRPAVTSLDRRELAEEPSTDSPDEP